MHFVLDFDEAGLHCVETLKMRAGMESGVTWTWLQCFVCLFAPFHMHNCSKMSGIGYTGPLQPRHMVSELGKLPDVLPSTILLR